MMMNRLKGPYSPLYWLLIACNIVIPQSLWSRRLRRNVAWLFAMSLVVNIGMWLERFVIVVVSLSRDFIAVSVGNVLSRRGGIGRRIWVHLDCSLRCFTFSFVSCR